MRVRIAQGRNDYLRAFRLVYEAYLTRGYIAPHPARIRFGPHYAYRTTRTLIAETRRGVVGTVSIVGDSRLGLPMDMMYSEEVAQLRQARRRLAEATGFAIRVPGRRQNAAIFFALTRFLVQYCYWCRYDDLLITVHPVQVPFYKQLLGFTPFAGCRPHPMVQGAPGVALRLDLRTAHWRVGRYLSRRYLYPRICPRQFAVPPMSEPERCYFYELYYGARSHSTVLVYEPPQRAA